MTIDQLIDQSLLKKSISLISASSISFIITFLSSIILLRIYSPADYGAYSVFLATVNIFAIIGTGQIQHAFFTIERNLWPKVLALIIVFGLSSIFIGSCLVWLFMLISGVAIDFIVVSFPLALGLTILQTLFLVMATLDQRLIALSFNKVWTALLPTLFSILLSLMFHSAQGLIWGFITGTLVSIGILLLGQHVEWPSKAMFNLKSLRLIFDQVKNFSKFTLTSELLNNLVNQVPLFYLGVASNLETAGLYKLANKVLAVPSSLIGGPISTLFKQEIMPELLSKGNARELYLKCFSILSISGFILFLVIFLFGNPLLNFLFGNQWTHVVPIINILIVLYFAKFIVSPLAYITQVTNRQKFTFKLAIVQGILIFFGFGISYLFSFSWRIALILYSILFSLVCIFTFWQCLRIASFRIDATTLGKISLEDKVIPNE